MARAKELHQRLDAGTGPRHHHLVQAVLAVRPFLGDDQFRHALALHKAAGVAKHSQSCSADDFPPLLACGGAAKACAPAASVASRGRKWIDMMDSNDNDFSPPVARRGHGC